MDNEQRKKSFESLFNEFLHDEGSDAPRNGHSFSHPADEDDEDESLYTEGMTEGMSDELDHEILMHRDAHFGGDFKTMIDYYSQEGIGVLPEITLERLEYLDQCEQELNQNLSTSLLSAGEIDKTLRSRKIYANLKNIYEEGGEENTIPRLIADLILTEDEEPTKETMACIEMGPKIVPELIQLIKTDEFYDPIFPGYGLAPALAIYCLGQIGDPTSIVPIFESLNEDIVFDEETVIEALVSLGDPAKEFLLKLLKGRPITEDNENAAFILSGFSEDPQIAKAALTQLQDLSIYSHTFFVSYLLCNCVSLEDPKDQQQLLELARNPNVPKEIQLEIESLAEDWK